MQTVVGLADKGDAYALLYLGLSYSKGSNGLSKDGPKAVGYLYRAAQGGSAEAGSVLAYIYAKGDGAPQDLQNSAKWYRWAADRDEGGAQGTLGLYYLKGLGGLGPDKQQAYFWLSLAVTRGNTKKELKDAYLPFLADLENQMKPDLIAEMQQSVRAWKPIAETTTPR